MKKNMERRNGMRERERQSLGDSGRERESERETVPLIRERKRQSPPKVLCDLLPIAPKWLHKVAQATLLWFYGATQIDLWLKSLSLSLSLAIATKSAASIDSGASIPCSWGVCVSSCDRFWQGGEREEKAVDTRVRSLWTVLSDRMRCAKKVLYFLQNMILICLNANESFDGLIILFVCVCFVCLICQCVCFSCFVIPKVSLQYEIFTHRLSLVPCVPAYWTRSWIKQPATIQSVDRSMARKRQICQHCTSVQRSLSFCGVWLFVFQVYEVSFTESTVSFSTLPGIYIMCEF